MLPKLLVAYYCSSNMCAVVGRHRVITWWHLRLTPRRRRRLQRVPE